MKRIRSIKGQGTLEYVLIAAAVVALAVILIKAVNPNAKARIQEITTGLSGNN
jgi:hypothetical protein